MLMVAPEFDYADFDTESIRLCEAINLFSPEILTVESCCGHGKDTFKIWIHLNDGGLERLPELLYWFDSCHSGCQDWHCEVYTDCGMSPVIFMVEGPIGDQAYKDANHIAGLIEEYVDGANKGD